MNLHEINTTNESQAVDYLKSKRVPVSWNQKVIKKRQVGLKGLSMIDCLVKFYGYSVKG